MLVVLVYNKRLWYILFLEVRNRGSLLKVSYIRVLNLLNNFNSCFIYFLEFYRKKYI